MLKTIKIIFLCLTFFTASSTEIVETWDEPWQKEILENAQYFVLAKVLSNVDSIGVEIEIIKYFGDQELSGKLVISHFSQLRMMSASGHGVHMDFIIDGTYYFFLSKTEDGHFAIPTPTSGFAYVNEEKKVYATYRHSYHQALIPQGIYEKTYSEIWNYFRTESFSPTWITSFVNAQLEEIPASFDEDQIDAFFLQHAALETAYLLGISIELNRLDKFISSENLHHRISGLQLLSNLNTEVSKDFLFEYIRNANNDNFEKVIAIWALANIGGDIYKEKLKAISEELSNEETGFGGNIMDPRIATFFPSPRNAVAQLK